MRDEISESTVRLAPDAAYDSATPERVRKGTVVVPRADDAGRQDGRIPPGRAAELGLVPKLHQVTPETAHLSRKSAADSGKSGDELYADFYESAAAGRSVGSGEMTPERKFEILSKAGYTVTPDGRVIPPGYRAEARGSVPVSGTKEDDTGGKRTTRPAARPQKRARRAKDAGSQDVSGSSGAPDVFRADNAQVGDDDTLDGFYDGLSGSEAGTAEIPARRPERPGEAAEGRGAGLPPTHAPRVREEPIAAVQEPASDPVADRIARLSAPAPQPDRTSEILEVAERIAAERDAALMDLDSLRRDYLSLKQKVAAPSKTEHALSSDNAILRERVAALEAQLLNSKKQSDTVRVQLGAEQEDVILYGEDSDGAAWQLETRGHVDFSRTRGELVLSVIDPAHASDVIAAMPRGELVLGFRGVSTHCTYSGVCDKIYGDPTSSDFITLFRFGVAGTGGGTGT